MNLRIPFALAALVAMMLPHAGAFDVEATPPALSPWESFDCNEDGPTPQTTAVFDDPLRPGTKVHVSLLCVGDASLDGHYGTDCASDSYSFWAGLTTSPRTYTYATSNDDGLSASAVTSAWNGGNTVWDSQVSDSLFAGSVAGGSGSSVGKSDGVNQVGFKRLGGSTLAVQYAWTSGGVIVESDGGYNTRVKFSTNGASGTYDLQGIAAQEFGHGYGLGHSDTSSASSCLTMYPYGSAGDTTKRTLGSGDIAGIKARYA